MPRRHVISDIESKGLDHTKPYDRIHKGSLRVDSQSDGSSISVAGPVEQAAPIIEEPAAPVVMPDPVVTIEQAMPEPVLVPEPIDPITQEIDRMILDDLAAVSNNIKQEKKIAKGKKPKVDVPRAD